MKRNFDGRKRFIWRLMKGDRFAFWVPKEGKVDFRYIRHSADRTGGGRRLTANKRRADTERHREGKGKKGNAH
jgi:hypothetical protein